MQIQHWTTKKSKPKKYKLKELKPAKKRFFDLLYTDKPAKSTCQNKKNKVF